MNKAINIFSGMLMGIYLVFAMILVYDLSLSSISFQGIPYQIEICAGFALVFLLLGILRIKRRWQGAMDMRKFKQFLFVRPVSSASLKRGLLHTTAEAIFMIAVLAILLNMAQISVLHVLPMICVSGVLLLEGIMFIFKLSKPDNSHRIGINKKAVAYYDREMHLFYFSGLRRIELYQDTINFQYIEDLNILLPLEVIRPEDRAPFRDALIDTIEKHVNTGKRKIIYIDDAFRSLE